MWFSIGTKAVVCERPHGTVSDCRAKCLEPKRRRHTVDSELTGFWESGSGSVGNFLVGGTISAIFLSVAFLSDDASLIKDHDDDDHNDDDDDDTEK